MTNITDGNCVYSKTPSIAISCLFTDLQSIHSNTMARV